MHRKRRINIALVLLSASLVLDVAILVSGDTSAGWLLGAIILLAGAGISLLVERREY